MFRPSLLFTFRTITDNYTTTIVVFLLQAVDNSWTLWSAEKNLALPAFVNPAGSAVLQNFSTGGGGANVSSWRRNSAAQRSSGFTLQSSKPIDSIIICGVKSGQTAVQPVLIQLTEIETDECE